MFPGRTPGKVQWVKIFGLLKNDPLQLVEFTSRVGFGMRFFRGFRDFLFWARSENPEMPEIGIWKSRKNPE